jgi:hypothetical protein
MKAARVICILVLLLNGGPLWSDAVAAPLEGDAIDERIERLNQIAEHGDSQEPRADAIFILFTWLLRNGGSAEVARVIHNSRWFRDFFQVPSACFGICSYVVAPKDSGSAYEGPLFVDSLIASPSTKNSWTLALKFSKVITKDVFINYINGHNADPDLILTTIVCGTPTHTQIFEVNDAPPRLISERLIGEPSDPH